MSARATLGSLEESATDGTPDPASGSVGHRLVALVGQILEKNGISGPIPVHEQLSTIGLTSLDMVGLMIAVESEFDLTIPANEITPANFRSVSTIEALVMRIRPASAA